MTFNLPVSWDSSGLGRFLSLPLVSDELECSEECQSHVFYNVPQLSFACCLPLIIILQSCVFRRKITEVKLSSHPIKGTNSQHAFSCWRWPWSPAQGPGCRLPLPPAALPTLHCPLCKSPQAAHTQGLGYVLPAWRQSSYRSYLELFTIGDLSVMPPLINSITYLYENRLNGYLLYTLL